MLSSSAQCLSYPQATQQFCVTAIELPISGYSLTYDVNNGNAQITNAQFERYENVASICTMEAGTGSNQWTASS